jgi:hypothetical protein
LKEENKTNQTKNKTKQNRRNKTEQTKQTKQKQNEALIIWVPPFEEKPSGRKNLAGRAHKLPYNYKLITKQRGEDLGEKREN